MCRRQKIIPDRSIENLQRIQYGMDDINLEDGYPFTENNQPQRFLLYPEHIKVNSIQDILKTDKGEYPIDLLPADETLYRNYCCRESFTLIFGEKYSFYSNVLISMEKDWKYRKVHFINVPTIFRFWLICTMVLLIALLCTGIGMALKMPEFESCTEKITDCESRNSSRLATVIGLVVIYIMVNIIPLIVIVSEILRLYYREEYIDIRKIQHNPEYTMRTRKKYYTSVSSVKLSRIMRFSRRDEDSDEEA